MASAMSPKLENLFAPLFPSLLLSMYAADRLLWNTGNLSHSEIIPKLVYTEIELTGG